MTEDLKIIPFTLILHAGNSRSLSMEALSLAKEKQFEEAKEKFAEAEVELTTAHKVQTELLFNEQNEETRENYDLDIIMVHAQDHLTMATICLDLCREISFLYETR